MVLGRGTKMNISYQLGLEDGRYGRAKIGQSMAYIYGYAEGQRVRFEYLKAMTQVGQKVDTHA
jgi:hypothetical protein